MALNKQKGNMYPWVTHTWNIIKGKCPHNCSYCYMKNYPQPELHFDEKELKTNLGRSNTIFVGSSCDTFAQLIPLDWTEKQLAHCRHFFGNQYLFQSKACDRFNLFKFPLRTILGTTIETDRSYPEISEAPTPRNRMIAMTHITDYHKMVSIEPIMDFNLQVLVAWIKAINPEFVSIGADSKEHKLPEPSLEKIQALIKALSKFTTVKVKNNLKRLTN